CLGSACPLVVGFLYGGARILMIETGAIAAVAIAFAQYVLKLAGTTMSPKPIALLTIVCLSAINYVGVKPGSRVLNLFVVLKVAALAIIIGVAFWGASAPE